MARSFRTPLHIYCFIRHIFVLPLECRMLDSAEIWEAVHDLNLEFASSLFGDTVVPLYGSVNATCKYGYKGEPISYVCKR